MRLVAVLACALAGCKSDQAIHDIPFDRVAVATGDFDEAEEALDRHGIPSDLYEGYIVGPVYETEREPGSLALKIEQLFREEDEDGQLRLLRYPAAFIDSGARGLGAWVYNGVEPDDDLVGDPDVVALVQEYANLRRTLVVSDWAYDLVEAAFPDRIEFLYESDGLDAAQAGLDDSIVARVESTEVADAIGGEQLEVAFDFSYWAVMVGVGDSVTVHLRGDATVRAADGSGTTTVEDVPLLVSFDTDAGRVIVSSFAWRAQRADVTDRIFAALIDGFDLQEDTGGG